MQAIAIIPARGGSKRIPHKNIRSFAGVPIIWHSIRAALASQCFSEVMVSTDDSEIAAIAQQAGASVPFFRSAKNSDDYATTADVLIEVIEAYKSRGREFSVGCCIYPVAALISPERLRSGLTLLEASEVTNGVVSVLRFGYPIQRALRLREGFLEMIHPEHLNARSQDLEPTYHDAGQYYWFRVPALLRERTLLGSRVAAVCLGELEAQDIDNEEDWRLAELKYRLSMTKNASPA